MRRRIAELVAVTTLLVLVLALVPVGLLLRSEAAANATANALLRAQSTADLVAGLGSASVQPDDRTTVFRPDGTTAGATAPKTPSVQLAERDGASFVAETTGGREVLVPVQSLTDGTTVVRVFIPSSELRAGVARSWLLLSLGGLALFATSMLAADALGRRVVRPIASLAGTASRLSEGDLTARVTPAGPPEVRQVGAELNRLALRIDELLTTARTESADLAHRLRTPLTALRLDVGGLRDPEESARLVTGVDRITAEVDEMIRTARRPVRAGGAVRSDLAEVARERLHFWSALADDAGRRLTGEVADGPIPVRIGADDLAALFDVLLDNAFRHTPEGTEIRVGVDAERHAWVEDAGPDLPPDGAPGSTRSTGIGLDIARRTALAAGGSLQLTTSPLGGLRATFDAAEP
ncbi:sensor histidine kinase [Kribbella sp. DT2]|uniref:sensor histidine kinase n=1 Tax=Kribbella sp. DT2 TaxID=3393427 RepID=UPI003CF7A505